MEGIVIARLRRTACTVSIALAACVVLAAPGPGEAVIVSRGEADAGGNADAYFGSVSSNGRIVALSTVSSNLGFTDGNNDIDIYVRDLGTGEVELISRDGDGNVGSAGSNYASVSANGRWVLYATSAQNLAPGAVNGQQIALFDRKSGVTTEVSTAADGGFADAGSDNYTCRPLSANGRWAVFESAATNLVDGDLGDQTDVFLADLRAGTLERISRGIAGEADGDSRFASISPNGRWVVYLSTATNLVAGDGNGFSDVFLYDVKRKTTVLVSKATDGSAGDDDSPSGYFGNAAVSNNGRLVAFVSKATNLDPDSADTNGFNDVFLRDLRAGTTKRISVGPMGAQADGAAYDIAITPSGKHVLFDTDAANMIDLVGGVGGDVIVRDVRTGTNRRLIEALGGGRAGAPDQASYLAAIGLSANGRWMTVSSPAADVVADDDNGKIDVFLVDLK
jgi:Tol biopolymer transport system component